MPALQVQVKLERAGIFHPEQARAALELLHVRGMPCGLRASDRLNILNTMVLHLCSFCCAPAAVMNAVVMAMLRVFDRLNVLNLMVHTALLPVSVVLLPIAVNASGMEQRCRDFETCLIPLLRKRHIAQPVKSWHTHAYELSVYLKGTVRMQSATAGEPVGDAAAVRGGRVGVHPAQDRRHLRAPG